MPELVIPDFIAHQAALNARRAGQLGHALPERSLQFLCPFPTTSEEPPRECRLALGPVDIKSPVWRLVAEVPGYPVSALEMHFEVMRKLFFNLPSERFKVISQVGLKVFPADRANFFIYPWSSGLGIQPVIQRPHKLHIPSALVLAEREVGLILSRLS